jgi:uncharacterized protein
MNEDHLIKAIKTRNDYEPRTRHWSSEGLPKYTNALILSQSPYLLQHAHNPVDWRSWSEETFEEAIATDRPIFLSIGYSTCHWCHVMERESFEDEEIAQWINEYFIPIKVDREERPDIDALYMDFVQITTGKGGWPMNIFMTPQKRPLFGGTYFPSRDGDRPDTVGLLTYLKVMSQNWKDPKLRSQSDKPLDVLKNYAFQPPASTLSPQWIEEAATHWLEFFDEDWGGFTAAPKFPRPATLEALLRAWHRSGESDQLKAVEVTLERMYCGGIYDHVGGGIARYSVDNRWWIPHFEKMLYDNVQLVTVYLEAYQITQRPLYARVAQDILHYVLKELRAPQGGLISAIDADSLNDKGEMEEGYFYTWGHTELEALCTEEELVWVCATFGVTPEGNFENGRNILRLYEPLNDEEEAYWAPIRAKLYRAREKRAKPMRDDKVICVWNSMAISAFARAATIFGEREWRDHAQDIADFMLNHLWNGVNLSRSWRAGVKNPTEGVLEDYMGFSCALLDLFEVSGELRYLSHAQEIYESAERFFDPMRGGFRRLSDDRQGELPFPQKPLIDGAEPSGNAWAALAGLKLAHITDQPHYRAQADSTLRAIGSVMSTQPMACPKALCALAQWFESRNQVILVQLPEGSPPLRHPLAHSAWQAFHPYTLRLCFRHIDESVKSIIPALKSCAERVETPQAFICSTRGCTPPISGPVQLRSALTKLS